MLAVSSDVVPAAMQHGRVTVSWCEAVKWLGRSRVTALLQSILHSLHAVQRGLYVLRREIMREAQRCEWYAARLSHHARRRIMGSYRAAVPLEAWLAGQAIGGRLPLPCPRPATCSFSSGEGCRGPSRHIVVLPLMLSSRPYYKQDALRTLQNTSWCSLDRRLWISGLPNRLQAYTPSPRGWPDVRTTPGIDSSSLFKHYVTTKDDSFIWEASRDIRSSCKRP